MNATVTAPVATCAPEEAVTRSLLGYGMLAGPFYVAVSVGQGILRDGFDFGRHAWSMLANGPYGWIQSANLVLTGLMVMAFAVGLRRNGAGKAAASLVGVFGAGTVGAGIFRADPGRGFPEGAPEGAAEASLHGMLHFVTSGVGFVCLVVAMLLLARRFAPGASRAVAVVFLAGFGCMAASGGAAWSILLFTGAVILAWGWVAALAAVEYRR
ncbi:DUF998 domain-containing protein [Actinocorallia sp. B10E7]|uniref:DUF998 domain-containing protein n=1 Tax=Actinocorallia sp. B10E7 TaxID=3153558 RepID=UPI00325DBFD2